MTSFLFLHIRLSYQSCGQRCGFHCCGLPKVIVAIAAAVLVAIVALKLGIFSRAAAVRIFVCILVL